MRYLGAVVLRLRDGNQAKRIRVASESTRAELQSRYCTASVGMNYCSLHCPSPDVGSPLGCLDSLTGCGPSPSVYFTMLAVTDHINITSLPPTVSATTLSVHPFMLAHGLYYKHKECRPSFAVSISERSLGPHWHALRLRVQLLAFTLSPYLYINLAASCFTGIQNVPLSESSTRDLE
jgi:hypothetical protein